MTGDGLGKYLGRAKDAEVRGDRVVADLHLSDTAHSTPGGDLAGYVLDLAEKEPAAFGASIVFAHDEDAELEHRSRHPTTTDKKNLDNLPHARLADLRAVDAVDDPAANPGGLFHRGHELAVEADAVFAYILGDTDQLPAVGELDIHPERVRGAFRRYLEAHEKVITTRAGCLDTARRKVAVLEELAEMERRG